MQYKEHSRRIHDASTCLRQKTIHDVMSWKVLEHSRNFQKQQEQSRKNNYARAMESSRTTHSWNVREDSRNKQ